MTPNHRDDDGVIRVTMDNLMDGFVEDTFLVQPKLLAYTKEMAMSEDEMVEYVADVVSTEWDLWLAGPEPGTLKLDPQVIAAVKRYLANS